MASDWYHNHRVHSFIQEVTACASYLEDPTRSNVEKKREHRKLEYWAYRLEDYVDEHVPSQITYK